MPEDQKADFKFQVIRQASVVDQIIEHFKQALIKGELKAGQRVPSEAELGAQFGVGRSAIREAMKVLRALGVVSIQQGNGTYIVDHPSPVMLNPLIFAIILETEMSDDLVQLRRLVEIGYCELAAQHATDDDWARIELAQRQLEAQLALDALDYETLAHLDLDFHHAILAASHNPLVMRIAQAVEEMFFASMRNTYAYVTDNLEQAIRFHRDIMHAIRAGDLEQIRLAVEASLVYWKEEVKKLRS
jgi:GntR family transcriptional regulator, transcriptional repressor for pyruvate dehydrogenase complex